MGLRSMRNAPLASVALSHPKVYGTHEEGIGPTPATSRAAGVGQTRTGYRARAKV